MPAIEPSEPRIFTLLELGSRCNNACIFCPSALDSATRPTVDLVRTIESAASSHAQRGNALRIVGGEPTLHEDLPFIIRFAKQCGLPHVVLRTNARRLAYSAYASILVSAGVDSLEVFLHGSSAPMHDYHTNVSGSFLQTLRGIHHATANRLTVMIKCVVTRSNFRHLAEIVTLGKCLGAKSVHFLSPDLNGRAKSALDRVVAHPDLAIECLILAEKQGRRIGFPVTADMNLGHCTTSVSDTPITAASMRLDSSTRANPARTEDRSRQRHTGEKLLNDLPLAFTVNGKEKRGR